MNPLPRILFGSTFLALASAWALDCPEPPRQAQKDWNVQITTEVARIGPVRGAELQTRVQTTTRDLLGKLPGADRVYLEQMMFSAYCTALRDDKSMPEGEKARQVLDYRRELQVALRR